ncbi:DUF2062 domain-containing protein [Haloferula sp.]|uniref:DUF2062 domain-containing protein n=1 Tax=Haloferula sp. TaxID=2497595 RepID=UPI00329FF3B7
MVRKVHRLLRHRRLRRQEWWKPIRNSLLDRRLWHPCRDTVAGGISIGLFFAMMPMPFQTLAAAAIAARAKVNIPFTVAACFVSNPLTEPFVRITQHRFGCWLRSIGAPMPKLGVVEITFDEKLVQLDVAAFIIGFLVIGVLLALAAYPIVHLFSAILPNHLPIKKHKLRPTREEARRSSAN